ncbi:hypothetical protein N9L48_02995 [Psychrosphaera sp.]|nr:hypothetical protein [Psychrosphaera sp.]
MRLVILLLFFVSLFAKADNTPLQWELQSGSLKGVMHGAIGYNVTPGHFFSVGFGVVPKENDRDALNIFSLNYMYQGSTQLSYSPWGKKLTIKPVNFGVSTIYSNDDSLFFSLPEGIPSGYYAPTAIRILFEYELTAQVTDNTDVFIKWSILDVGLINYARNYSFYRDNYELLGLAGISSWGIGIRRAF